MTDQAPRCSEVTAALTASRATDWEARVRAAKALGDGMSRPEAQTRLVEMLDDENLAVGEAAAEVLVQRGGLNGLALVAVAFTVLDEQPAWYVALAVSAALGEALADRLDTLIAESPDEQTRSAAGELRAFLIHEPGR